MPFGPVPFVGDPAVSTKPSSFVYAVNWFPVPRAGANDAADGSVDLRIERDAAGRLRAIDTHVRGTTIGDALLKTHASFLKPLDKILDSGKIKGLTDQLTADGHHVETIDFEYLDYIVPTYYILTTAEASSNLSRYDGIRYGFSHVDKKLELTDFYCQNRSAGFGWEVKKRIMLGSFVLSSGYYDAYFTKAQQVRQLLLKKTQLIFSRFDAIILPNYPTTAFSFGKNTDDPIAIYLADIFTVFSNLTGIPGISLPLFWHSNGIPFGVQVMTNQFSELSLLQLSNQWMQLYRERN